MLSLEQRFIAFSNRLLSIVIVRALSGDCISLVLSIFNLCDNNSNMSSALQSFVAVII
jgi:hypothetical protein